MRNNLMSSSRSYDVMVVGMGPVGLAAAYEAAKNGKKVLIIEKRPEDQAAVRPQVVVLESERKKQLLNMIAPYDTLNEDDIKFLDALAHSAEVKLRDVEIAKELLKHGANPFTPISRGANSLFYAALTSKDYKNHNFAVECLKAAQDRTNPLYKIARSELSTKMIKDILDNIHKIDGLSDDNRSEIVKILSAIKDEKSQKFSFNTLFSPRKEPANDANITKLDQTNENDKKVRFK